MSSSSSSSTSILGRAPRGVATAAVVGGIALLGYAAFKYFSRDTKPKFVDGVKGYETKRLVYEYLFMHYGHESDLMFYKAGPREALEFPRRCAERCIALAQATENAALGGSKARVMDLGCAVGRSSFELAKYFEDVVGVDYSNAFVQTCQLLQQRGTHEYEMRVEGDILEQRVATIDRATAGRCTFQVGDACALDTEALIQKGKFAIVLGANLVCRLPKPRTFLRTVGSIIAPGGFLVLPSPYTWLEAFTPKSEWLGGYVDEKGVGVRTFEGLQRELATDFELVSMEDSPFFIRNTYRHNQYTVAHVTVWKRRKLIAPPPPIAAPPPTDDASAMASPFSNEATA